ncbi:hypothetical protein DUNSADRAFT_16329 [Dunaliella salina]|uniref:Uncharacterized protein n=1 Tax=Dunaliella salina TaxID=3046 RepID=A0ABQ7G3S7_DUNSA|nr:hypothetical protein DUNSADRAFT_16329 [Dunaliella salina]|eukprot:KAF5829256.1 hypothetical protein DUNSADRAFT_16329 [Dunaliella salina]
MVQKSCTIAWDHGSCFLLWCRCCTPSSWHILRPACSLWTRTRLR